MTGRVRWYQSVARSQARSVTLLVIVSVAVRGIYLFGLTEPLSLRSDAGQYDEIARNVVSGQGISTTFPQFFNHATAFRPPLYPMLLASVYWLTGGSILAGKLLNVVLGTLVVLAGYMVGRRIRSPFAGLSAGLLIAIYPPLVANDVNLLSEPLGLCFLLISVVLVADGRWIPAGITVGLLSLTRPSAILLGIVLLPVMISKVGWRRGLGYLLVLCAVISPWIARNVIQVGTWNPYTSNGFNLAALYSIPAQDSGGFVDPVRDVRFDEYRFAQFDEASWDKEMMKAGLHGIKANPSYVVANVAHNTAATFELWPPFNDGAEYADGRNLEVRIWTLPLFYVVTVLGILGLWRSRRNAVAMVLIVSIGYLTLINLLILAPPRLRAPFDLGCCIGAGVMCAELVARLRDRRRVPGNPSESGQATPAGESSEELEPSILRAGPAPESALASSRAQGPALP